MGSTIKVTSFLLLALGGLLIDGQAVVAAPATASCTFPVRDTYWCDVSVAACDTASITLTLNKDLYTPGETIAASGAMSLTNPASGANDLLTYYLAGFTWELYYHHNLLSATINGVTKEFFNLPFGSGTWDASAMKGCKLSGSCPAAGAATFTAPSTAGTHTATFRGFIEQDYYSGPLTAEKTCSLTYTVGTPVTQLPDLTAGALNEETAVAAVAKTFSVRVSNIGNAPTTGAFWNLLQRADSYDSPTDTPTNVVDLRSPTSAASPKTYGAILNSGASGTVTFNPYTFSAADAAAGTRWLRACADKSTAGAAGMITEADEDNNCGPWTKVTVTAAAEPNLKGLGMTISIPSPSTAQAVTFAGNISNIGDAPMSTYPNVFYITNSSGVLVARVPAQPVSTHAAGVTTNVTSTAAYIFATPGTYTVRVAANMSDTGAFPAVAENIYTNNLGTPMQVVVSPPTLTTPDLTANPTTPGSSAVLTGTAITFTSSARNIGTDAATSFPNVFRILNGAGTQTLLRLDAGSVASLAAGATSASLSRLITFNAVGTYLVDLCTNMDTAGHIGITELNPDNNCGEQATITVTNTTPPPVCTAGSGCVSAANNCGETTTGTYNASCVCSATPPPDRATCGGGGDDEAPTVSIDADPDRIPRGAITTVTWHSSDPAASCTITRQEVIDGVRQAEVVWHETTGSGSKADTITTQTVYAVTCDSNNGAGPSAPKKKVVNYIPGPTEF